MQLEKMIYNVDNYINTFNGWDVKEIIIDDQRAFWEIKKPDSEFRKVCLFRDGINMCVYGDYGSYMFDSMTWFGSPHNLEYNNLPYQNEKLSHESKSDVYVFDEDAVKEDIIDWFKDVAINRYCYNEDKINNIISHFEHERSMLFEAEDFCYKHTCDDLVDILNFVDELILYSDDEIEYIGFLRNSAELENFDETCESDLWKAGKRTQQGYLVSFLALKICGEKLSNQAEKKDGK